MIFKTEETEESRPDLVHHRLQQPFGASPFSVPQPQPSSNNRLDLPHFKASEIPQNFRSTENKKRPAGIPFLHPIIPPASPYLLPSPYLQIPVNRPLLSADVFLEDRNGSSHLSSATHLSHMDSPSTPEEISCTQVSDSTQSNVRMRGAGFSVDEDVLLVNAWVNVSTDAVQGNEHKRSAFWERVANFYHANKTFATDRSSRMLMQRWIRVQAQVNKFCYCYDTICAKNRSGPNERHKIMDAKKMYEKTEKGKKFTLEHAWNILRFQPKWMNEDQEIANESSSKKAKTSSSENASFSQFSVSPINLGDEESNTSTFERTGSPGRKAEKAKQKQASPGTPELGRVLEILSEMREDKKVAEDKKIALLKEKIEQDKRKMELAQARLEVKKERTQLRKMEMEMAIFSMDTSQMSEDQRLFYTWKKQEILARGFGGSGLDGTGLGGSGLGGSGSGGSEE